MAKGCHCDYESDRRRLLRRILIGILAFIILILFIVFLIWAILRPTKPRFILQDGTVYNFNLSSSTNLSSPFPTPTDPTPTTLSLTMQVSLYSHNPNDRIGVYYHSLQVFASYRGQQISLPTTLPPTYQGHNDVAVWSPFLYGTAVPVSPYAMDALREDQNAGEVMVDVKVEGRVKWKVGTWESGRYHILVDCPAYVKFAGEQGSGVGVVGPAMKLQLLQTCNVEV